MRFVAAAIFVTLMTPLIVSAQTFTDFSGKWVLNESRSRMDALPEPADVALLVEQKGSTLNVTAQPQQAGQARHWSFSLSGTQTKSRVGDYSWSSVTKWEGSALLVNTIAVGPRQYTFMDRWVRARDGHSLTIERTVVTRTGEIESTLFYDNDAVLQTREGQAEALAAAPAPRRPSLKRSSEPEVEVGPSVSAGDPGETVAARRPEPPVEVAREVSRSTPRVAPSDESSDYIVEKGTRILLSLTNSVNTKSIGAGDRVYLQTAYPISSKGRIVVPAGSYVIGTVTDAQRAGRVKGKASLYLRFDSLTLPNGVTRDFRARIGESGDANVDRAEGRINGDSNKGGDARKVGEATAAGAGIGTIAGAASGHYGMGAGIGAAAGAVGGLIGVLGSRGPDVMLPRGTTMEMVLDRDIHFTDGELPPEGRRGRQ